MRYDLGDQYDISNSPLHQTHKHPTSPMGNKQLTNAEPLLVPPTSVRDDPAKSSGFAEKSAMSSRETRFWGGGIRVCKMNYHVLTRCAQGREHTSCNRS